MYQMNRNDCLAHLARLADGVIFDRVVLTTIRDEDDIRWAELDAEHTAEQAMQFAQENYPIVINNEGGQHG